MVLFREALEALKQAKKQCPRSPECAYELALAFCQNNQVVSWLTYVLFLCDHLGQAFWITRKFFVFHFFDFVYSLFTPFLSLFLSYISILSQYDRVSNRHSTVMVKLIRSEFAQKSIVVIIIILVFVRYVSSFHTSRSATH